MYKSTELFVLSYVNQTLGLLCTGRRNQTMCDFRRNAEVGVAALVMQLSVNMGCRSRYVLSPYEDGLLFQSNTTGLLFCGDVSLRIVGVLP